MAFDSVCQRILSQIVTVPFVKRPFQVCGKPQFVTRSFSTFHIKCNLKDNSDPTYYTMRSCVPVSIPVEGGSEESAVEEEFLSGWFMAPDNYNDEDATETEGDADTGCLMKGAQCIIVDRYVTLYCVEVANAATAASSLQDRLGSREVNNTNLCSGLLPFDMHFLGH